MGLLAALAVLGATTARAESLDRELKNRAPEVIQFLKGKGCRNVGVLKFLVREGEGEATQDDTGAVSLDMARHLTVALVWAQYPPPKDEDLMGIIRDADAVAAKLTGADYRKAEGVRKLLAADYPLAWGDGKLIVKADGFLTGEVKFSPRLDKVTVQLAYIDGNGEHPVFDADHLIQAEPDSALLASGGLSFLTRGGLGDDGEPKIVPAPGDPPPPPKPNPGTLAAKSALKVKEGKPKDFPLKDKDAPVDLEIDYGAGPEPIAIQDGKASVAEPKGRKVVFRLKRTPAAKDRRYAVVLLVNGVNTLYSQRFSADYHAYSKWVLEPKADPIEIRGFQKNEDTADEFRIESPQESREDQINYGDNVGKITLVVFPEQQSGKTNATDRRVASTQARFSSLGGRRDPRGLAEQAPPHERFSGPGDHQPGAE